MTTLHLTLVNSKQFVMLLYNFFCKFTFRNMSTKLPLIEQQATQAEEKKDSLAIFFILLIIVIAILLVHGLIITKVHYMPESLAIVLLGILFFAN